MNIENEIIKILKKQGGKKDIEEIFREIHKEAWDKFCKAIDTLTDEGSAYMDDNGDLYEVPLP